MIITFKELTLKNYKSHQDLVVNFGEVTKITGDNAKGKSSILDAACWLLYGKSITGSKVDPTPVTYEANEISVSLLFNEGEKDLLLTRAIVKGKNEFEINEVPAKAKEFEALVKEIFPEQFFMSLFNPLYFPSLHWQTQREMLLSYVPGVLKKNVFKRLSKPESEVLEPLLEKNDLQQIEDKHKKNKTKKEKEHISAQSAVKTLEGEYSGVEIEDTESLKQELEKARAELEKLDTESLEASKTNAAHQSKSGELENARYQLERMKSNYMKLYNEPIESECPRCERPLDEDSVLAVETKIKEELTEKRKEFDEQKLVVNRIKSELESLPKVDLAENHSKARELNGTIYELSQKLSNAQRDSGLIERIEKAKQDEKSTHDSLKESVFILDAIKSFRSEEADLQAESVEALFDTLSIKLFEVQKNGEEKPTFVIQMDGKDFNKLSLSESIRAGIELREVLSKQSEVIAPCFVDNAESITRYKGPSGQLITSTVVPDKELEVVTE